MIQTILDILAETLPKHGFQVIDSSEGCIVVRVKTLDRDFELRVLEMTP